MRGSAVPLQRSTRTLLGVGVALLVLVIGAAVLADVLAAHPPNRASGPPYARPSSAHWLGTDDLGRDLFSQLLHGARVSLAVGLIAATLATLLGTAVGLVAGWVGGWVDALAMRLVDLTLALPFLVLVLVLAAYFGRGLETLTLLIAGVLWARPARLLRSQVLKVSRFGHVRAAQVMGASVARILLRHVLPRMVPLLTSVFVRAAAVAVIVQAGVAFLGLGDPHRISWGGTLFFANNGAAILTDAWLWWIIPPGMALAVVIVGLAFVGYALEERAEPRLVSHGWRRPVRRRLPADPAPPAPTGTILDVRGLTVRYGTAIAVGQMSIAVRRGRVLGIVGESGSGKSTLVLAVLGLLPTEGVVAAGEVVLGDVDLRRIGRDGLTALRGREVALVPQAAMNLLDPTMTVHAQVAEVARRTAGRDGAAARAHELLELVGVARGRHRAHPHEFSGGMRQRVVIAMAVANGPRLLIADEPTTGLDVVTQAEVLQLLHRLRREMDLELVLVTHDLGVVRAHADDVVVMQDAQVVEHGPVAILDRPEHPHLQELLARSPSLDGPIRPWSQRVDAVVAP
jgi:ABC-type dipeptide/oligopeptide/nickel transport system ATPase component/ABC-type dipeptide/oligopeptide/nickel transport system permease subunit